MIIANQEVSYLSITIYMGDQKLTQEDFKRYICVSEYVINLVNEVYYSKVEEIKKKQAQKKNAS